MDEKQYDVAALLQKQIYLIQSVSVHTIEGVEIGLV